MTSEDYEVL